MHPYNVLERDNLFVILVIAGLAAQLLSTLGKSRFIIGFGTTVAGLVAGQAVHSIGWLYSIGAAVLIYGLAYLLWYDESNSQSKQLNLARRSALLAKLEKQLLEIENRELQNELTDKDFEIQSLEGQRTTLAVTTIMALALSAVLGLVVLKSIGKED